MLTSSAPLRSSLILLVGVGALASGVIACGDNRGGNDEVADATGESAEGSTTLGQEAGTQDGSSSGMDTTTLDGTATDTTATMTDSTSSSSMDTTTLDGTATDTTTLDGTATDTTTLDGTATDTGMVDFCNKVDFLFVIDNSISMLPEQTSLAAAFPGFIQAIEDSLDTDDHILVTDTDLSGWCTPGNCANPNNLHPTCQGPNSYACTGQFDDCDITLGAGVVRPAGQGASNMFCDPFGGKRYIVEAEPDKTGTFDCMAHVGLAGFPAERPVDAIVQALSPGLNQAGGCNDAFLRDDAILVVTFISDDDGNNEVNTMAEAYAAIVAAKGGDADRIVMLGLMPAPDNNCSFTPGAGEHWLSLIEMFGERGLHGPSCDDDFVPFFQGAVDVIVQACQDNPQ